MAETKKKPFLHKILKISIFPEYYTKSGMLEKPPCTGLTGNGINISLPPRDGSSRDQRERKPSGGNNRGRNLSDRSKNQGVNNRKPPKKGGPPAAAGLKSENITLLKRTDDELKSDGSKVSANIMAPNYLKK